MIQRTAIRAIVLATDSVLMIQARVPDTGKILWMMPGGGIDPGEDDGECLARELFEETGYRPTLWHGPVWTRRHQFRFLGEDYDQEERFYLVRSDQFEPTIEFNPATHEVDSFIEFRWWPISAMAKATDIFVPLNAAHHLSNLNSHPLPATPIDVSDP